LLDKYPSLAKSRLEIMRLTNKHTGESSGFISVNFDDRQNVTENINYSGLHYKYIYIIFVKLFPELYTYNIQK
jgi:hypothetical protein